MQFITKFTSFLITCLVLFSCSKNDSNTPSSDEYFIKAKLNGQLLSVSGYTAANLNGATFSGVARQGVTNAIPGFSIDIEDATTITTKTYLKNAAGIALMFRYNQSASKLYYLYMPNETFTITITEINNTYVTGTFNGPIRADGNENDLLQVTEGEFKLKRN